MRIEDCILAVDALMETVVLIGIAGKTTLEEGEGENLLVSGKSAANVAGMVTTYAATFKRIIHEKELQPGLHKATLSLKKPIRTDKGLEAESLKIDITEQLDFPAL